MVSNVGVQISSNYGVSVFTDTRSVASFPSRSRLQFLIACSMQTVRPLHHAGGQYHSYIGNSLTLIHVKTTLPGCVTTMITKQM